MEIGNHAAYNPVYYPAIIEKRIHSTLINRQKSKS